MLIEENLAQFRKELQTVNNWWLTSKVKNIENFPIKRKHFTNIIDEINSSRIIIITGPRRVGKSVLINQTIDNLIKNNTNPKNILYYSLDDPILYTYSDNVLKDILDYFLENISDENKQKYIFLDEIHNFKEWYKWIKAYYDKRKDIKFVISGSSSLSIQKESNKYLRGRTVEIDMYTLSFEEFLTFYKVEYENLNLNKLFKLKNIELEQIKHKLGKYFKEYLIVGGFPEWFEIKNEKNPVLKWFNRLIDDIPKKAIYEDVATMFDIRNPKILEQIFTFICANQSKILSYETINDIVKLDRFTLVNYIEFLKSSYLIVEILKYANIKEQLKSKKKYLTIDQGLRNAVLKDYEIKEENEGFIIENLVGIYLWQECQKRNKNLFYWRINGEVDFIIRDKGLSEVEVKYRNNIKQNDLKNVYNLIQNNIIDVSFIVTKNLLKKETIGRHNIYFIPAVLYLITSIE